ncbi:class I SAM-dependent methyltransferase [Nonomuraea sp. NPDC049309]|uniref:class I SAM-dependent methyltransferase n=1 Tax=Nonomuraea sp. NPDC049309 TaxID=3364350 RepID=UPI003722646A
MATTSRTEFQHPRFAQAYVRVSELADRRGAYEHRRRLLAGLQGRVIEIGAGNGRNFPHYPPAVTEVVAVEPDDTLRAHAAEQARSAPVPVSVVPGHAGALPADDDTMDAAVVSLVLCSVPEQRSALAEIVRVLAPGGRLHFYEHVRSPRRPIAVLQDLITPAWRRAAGGCHPNRDTLAEIERAGFEVAWIDRFRFAPNPPVPPHTHILGAAVLKR